MQIQDALYYCICQVRGDRGKRRSTYGTVRYGIVLQNEKGYSNAIDAIKETDRNSSSSGTEFPARCVTLFPFIYPFRFDSLKKKKGIETRAQVTLGHASLLLFLCLPPLFQSP